MSLLNKLNNVKKAADTETRIPMTEAQIADMKVRLKAQNRLNVLPNTFDVKTPFRVALNYKNEWTNHGFFTNVDVATAVGSLVSLAYFGDKAIQGEFNQEIAENHPEFKAWLANPLNADVLKKLGESQEAVSEEVLLSNDEVPEELQF